MWTANSQRRNVVNDVSSMRSTDFEGPASLRPSTPAKKVKIEVAEVLGVNERLTLIDIKDSNKRKEAWGCIKKDMKDYYDRPFQELELYRAYRNLRDTFRRKQKEAREASARTTGAEASQNVEQKLKSWPFYEALSFLGPVDQGTRYCTTIDEVEVDSMFDSRESSSMSTPVSATSKSSARTTIRPLPAIAIGREPQPQKRCRDRIDRGAFDEIASALREPNDMDRFEITWMNIAAKLRELYALDPLVGEQWVLNADELAVGATRAIIDIKSRANA